MRRKTHRVVHPLGRQRLRILQLLVKHGELSGSDLLTRDKSLPRGTIYTTLKRLEMAKFVTSRQITRSIEPGPARRSYKVTKRGTQCCRLELRLARAVATSG